MLFAIIRGRATPNIRRNESKWVGKSGPEAQDSDSPGVVQRTEQFS
jgi:hypothetical protein